MYLLVNYNIKIHLADYFSDFISLLTNMSQKKIQFFFSRPKQQNADVEPDSIQLETPTEHPEFVQRVVMITHNNAKVIISTQLLYDNFSLL